MDHALVEVLSDGEDSSDLDVVILSDDEADKSARRADPLAPPLEKISVSVTPMEVLIQLAHNKLESTSVIFTFFLAHPKTANTATQIKINSPSTMYNVSVNLDKSTIELSKEVSSDQCIATFSLKPSSPMQSIGVHLKIAQVADTTNLSHQSVQTFLITTTEVDPQCACFDESFGEADISSSNLDSSLLAGETRDMIVLFFSAKDAARVAVACNKKKPFQDLINAHKSQFSKYGDGRLKFKFTNVKTKQSCLADQSPESIGLSHQDNVFVSKCKCLSGNK